MDNKKVIVGGTFDILHEGHKALFKKAFELGDVFVGLTSDEMVKKYKTREIRSFKERKKGLEDFLRKELGKSADINEINDKFGFSTQGDFDYIVISPETYETALEINELRQKNNKKPLEIVKIDFVMAKDGEPISSTRISKGEIDKEGGIKGRN